MGPFEQATTWELGAFGSFGAEIGAEWTQGRAVWGGLLAAGILRSILRSAEGPEQEARTLHLHLCAGVQPGPVELLVRLEREGLGLAFYSVRLLQRGKVAVLGSATLARPRDPSLDFDQAPRPPLRPFAACPPLPREHPLLPPFTRYLEYRSGLGPDPLSGSEQAKGGGWLRPLAPTPLDAPLVAAWLDAWPPALYSRLQRPVAMGTLSYLVHFFDPLPPGPAPELALLVGADRCVGGWSDETDELWTADGRLLGRAHQAVVAIGGRFPAAAAG
jgi:hypothetical protein